MSRKNFKIIEMKKILTFTIIIISLNLFGQQQIPNSSFENWSGTDTLELDDEWYSLNMITQDYPNYGILRTTDAYDGTYALRLVSGEVDATPFGFPLIDTTAQITLGNFTDSGPNDGMPFTSKPEKLTFYYKYTPGAYPTTVVDTGLIYIKFENSALGGIGEGAFRFFGNAVTVYTYAEIPITYWNSDQPDSLFLNISSSTTGFNQCPDNVAYAIPNQIGSELIIDKMVLVYQTGINELNNMDNSISIYPNPANEKLFVNSKNKLTNYSIYNSIGELISEGKIINSFIYVNNLQRGFYYVKIKTVNQFKVLKFIKD
jgi:hypothetical protein